MALNFSLSQRLEQRLKMTAQMIQSIEMLQLPIMALEQQINAQLAENPVLEVVEQEVEVDPREADLAERDAEGDFAKLDEMARDEEWEDALYSMGTRRASSGEEDPKLSAMQNTAARSETLQEFVAEQIRLSDAPERTKEIALVIAFELDDNGYLLLPPEEIFSSGTEEEGEGGEEGEEVATAAESPDGEQDDDGLGPVAPEEIEAALELIRSLDPAGVGARTVEECLLIQLRREENANRRDEVAGRGPRARAKASEDNGPSLIERLIAEHFDDLLHNRLPKVSSALGVTIERVKEGIARIAHLKPRPGQDFSPRPPQYVVPDVIIDERDGEYLLRMNDSLPQLRVSSLYRDLLKKQKRGSPARDFLREKMQSAKWLIDSIAQRRNTLQKIAVEIVKAQRGFLEHGVSELKPLMMQNVAATIGMHVSTVSRAIADKYIDTPQGQFAMRYFFTGGYKTAGGGDGGEVSNKSVMNRISEMIDKEDKKKPLSDAQIVKMLRGEGLDIARRTVAKYREKLHIPASRQRKEY
ncbi:MAG: RNA polymerase factor sigma-54 [Planctomycetota bacterium]|jgi:RNA polymerase sigma-54 factor